MLMQPSGRKGKILTTAGTASHRHKREVTLIVLGKLTALVAPLAGINYEVIANHVAAKKVTKVALQLKTYKDLCHP
jgi:hypothetical protein